MTSETTTQPYPHHKQQKRDGNLLYDPWHPERGPTRDVRALLDRAQSNDPADERRGAKPSVRSIPRVERDTRTAYRLPNRWTSSNRFPSASLKYAQY